MLGGECPIVRGRLRQVGVKLESPTTQMNRGKTIAQPPFPADETYSKESIELVGLGWRGVRSDTVGWGHDVTCERDQLEGTAIELTPCPSVSLHTWG